MAPSPHPSTARRRYRWPWFVLAAFLVGVALAVLWMSREVARTRQYREFNNPVPETNSPPAAR